MLQLISALAALLAFAFGPSVTQERTRLATPDGTTTVRCGSGGQRVQVLYVRAEGRPDRYRTYLPFIGGWAVDADRTLREHGHRGVAFVERPGCVLDVRRVMVPAGADRTLAGSIAAVAARGYDRPGRIYLLFVDAGALPCGAARPGFARVDTGCWFSTVAGAVVAQQLLRAGLR
jgi:hypothetical protein